MARRIVLIVGNAVAFVAAGAQQATPIDRAGWLAGCWEMRAQNRVTMEMWMPPAGGLMLGASRTTMGSAVREFEQLRIRAAGDTLVYTAIPSGQRETDFRSTSISATTMVFENPTHDFPRKISYRRVTADSIVARVEGPGSNNATRGFDIPMRRASCTTPPAPPPPPDTLTIDADQSPDGKRLAVVRGISNWDVFLMNADGSGARKLTDHPAVDYMPVWSPDGARIAFVSVRDGHQEIYTVRPDGAELTQLTRGAAHNSEPAWSPDGRSIAFRSERDGRPQIYLMQADGSAQRALTRDSAGAAAPAWSPDGTRILFGSSRGGRSEVWVMNADGTAQTQLTNTPQGHSGLPSWSPDGSTIAFWSTRDGNDEVYAMGADGSNPRNISRHPARDAALGWTRDSAYILFRSTRDRPANDIYRMKPDGSDVTRVTVTR